MMPDATSTSRQLQAFRESFGTQLPTHSMWMSATLDPSILDVVGRPFTYGQIRTVSGNDLGIACPSLSATKTFSQLCLEEVRGKDRGGQGVCGGAGKDTSNPVHRAPQPVRASLGSALRVFTPLCPTLSSQISRAATGGRSLPSLRRRFVTKLCRRQPAASTFRLRPIVTTWFTVWLQFERISRAIRCSSAS